MTILARLLLALVLGIATPAALAAPRTDLTIGLAQYPASLHPTIDAMMAKVYVLGMSARPLTAFNAKWDLVCVLCETLPSLENGLAKRETTPDGKTGVALTYTLRADAFWADGVPVTTKDILFTWELGRHPQSGVTSAEMYRRILKIDVKDAKTFTIHVDRLTFDYNAFNSFQPLPDHLERPVFQADPATYRTRSLYDQDSTRPGLYNGPYRVAQTVAGSHLVLERNPYWRGKRPQFDRVVLRAVENSAAMEAQLLSGGIDMVAGELAGLPLEQALALEKRGDPRFQILTKPGLVYEHLDVNLDDPALSDRRVRQALMYGLDRDTIGRQLFGGRQPLAHTQVNPLDGVHADDVPTYGYDPARAAKLLDQAGWLLKGGLRRNAAGRPLAVEITTTAGNRQREMLSQVIMAQWRALGIEARLKTEPPRIFFGETVTKRRFAQLALFAWISAPESVPRTTLHSDQIPNAANNWSGQNTTGYKNAEMDTLLERIETELDKPKRVELWRRLQSLYATDLPALPLFFRADAYILPKAMTGLVPTGHQDPSTLAIEDWRWEP